MYLAALGPWILVVGAGSLLHVGSSSLIRVRTQAPCIGRAESQSLGH